MRWSPQKTLIAGVAAALLVALLVKYFWPVFVFDQPLGYDPGFYRYLFLKHAEGFPPFSIVKMQGWARGHPLGLFFFTTIFLRMGMPVDWLIGWMWNLFPVLLAASLAWVTAKRMGVLTGLLVLVAALLSVAYFDGFAAMYWKTYASLFWCVWAFFALEKRSWWSVPLGILTVATHHQTGFLFGLCLLTWFILPFIPGTRSTESFFVRGKRWKMRDIVMILGAGFTIFAIGLLTYLPIWREAVSVHLSHLFELNSDASGSFPEPKHYLSTAWILLLLGAYGFAQSIYRTRWTLWQLAVLWSFAFVALHLFFYRRFFLQLDFFLLPFVAYALADLLRRFKDLNVRALIVALLIGQLYMTYDAIKMHGPLLPDTVFHAFLQEIPRIPENAYVLGLENRSVVVLRGWLPHHKVGGPGLFENDWTRTQWQTFMYGAHDERKKLLTRFGSTTWMFVSPEFRAYYGPYGEEFLADTCFAPTESSYFYSVTCIPE